MFAIRSNNAANSIRLGAERRRRSPGRRSRPSMSGNVNRREGWDRPVRTPVPSGHPVERRQVPMSNLPEWRTVMAGVRVTRPDRSRQIRRFPQGGQADQSRSCRTGQMCICSDAHAEPHGSQPEPLPFATLGPCAGQHEGRFGNPHQLLALSEPQYQRRVRCRSVRIAEVDDWAKPGERDPKPAVGQDMSPIARTLPGNLGAFHRKVQLWIQTGVWMHESHSARMNSLTSTDHQSGKRPARW